MPRTHLVLAGLVAAGLVGAGLMGVSGSASRAPAQARPARPAPVAPSALVRGDDPGVAWLHGDTLHDGVRRVPAPRWGRPTALWTVGAGFVIETAGTGMHGGDIGRLTWVSGGGTPRLLARDPVTAAVSGTGGRVAWTASLGELGPPTRVTVTDARSGRVLGRHTFGGTVSALAVTRRWVLLAGLPSVSPGTWWWDYRRDTAAPLIAESALAADLRHGRVVLATGDPAGFCSRVAPLSHPLHTLWRSCHVQPRQWSPDGRHAIATHGYLDETGTNLWQPVEGGSGRPGPRVTGRLDWSAVWEDDRHFLTLAMGEDGRAAVVRCDLQGVCERASRTWVTGWTAYPPAYVSPPVLLAR